VKEDAFEPYPDGFYGKRAPRAEGPGDHGKMHRL
jgi:hypothetical protein